MYSHRTAETASRALAIVFLSMLVCLPVPAGNIDSPAPPGDPTAYLPSFAEVCARLASGANPGAPPGSFVEPGGPPVSSPLCDLQDLLNMTPAPDNVAGATPGEVVCGKAYWGLRTDGSWGLQSGTRACTGCELDCVALFDKPNAFGQCNTGGAEPECELVCCAVGSDDPACDGLIDYFDLNGVLADGCEFQLDPDAIYVSESDPAAADTAGCGTDPWLPCATISFGIGEAVSSARSQVLVANGAYDESITVQDGISLLGGYRADTWERNVSATGTAIYGGGGGGSHRKTITVSGVSSTTTVEGFLVYGQQNVNSSGNSYAVWIANTGTALS
ncbi:MAG: hypothetical protein GY711_08345, partial [bacterium]|nr:hypothetical protein [bacterium]